MSWFLRFEGYLIMLHFSAYCKIKAHTHFTIISTLAHILTIGKKRHILTIGKKTLFLAIIQLSRTSPVKWLIYKIKAQACSNSVVRLGIVRGVSRTFLPPQINNQTLFISLYEYLFISKEKSCIFYSIIKYHSRQKHLWVYYFSTGFDNKYFKNHNSNFKILEVLTKNSGNQFQTIKIDL